MLTATKSPSSMANTLTLETGEIGRQADAAVLVRYGDTVVLVSAVAKTSVKEGQDFFPLTVDYQEKFYAAGKIPGGFFKREGPSDRERNADRAPDRSPDPPAVPGRLLQRNPGHRDRDVDGSGNRSRHPGDDRRLGGALPVGRAVRRPDRCRPRRLRNGEYIPEPDRDRTQDVRDGSGRRTETAVMMVESEAAELPEDVMLGAVWCHAQQQPAIDMIMALGEVAGQAPGTGGSRQDPALVAKVAEIAGPGFDEAYKIVEERARSFRPSSKVLTAAEAAKDPGRRRHADQEQHQEQAVRPRSRRPFASRSCAASRASTAATPAPCARSRSAPACCRAPTARRCSRGETQALVVATLGTKQDEQIIDALGGEYRDRFMLHYNMPPFATGETGRVGSPKRREIGHGRLPRQAFAGDGAAGKGFSYSMRVVSRSPINGSSSWPPFAAVRSP